MKMRHGIETQFPVLPQDKVNSLFSNNQIHSVLYCSGIVDLNLISLTQKYIFQMYPIMNCKLTETQGDVAWEAGKQEGEYFEFELLEDARELEKKIKAYMLEVESTWKSPQVRMKIFRGTHDVICIKVQHTYCDGAGLKKYLQMFTSTYTSLCKEDIDFKFSLKEGDRGKGAISKYLSSGSEVENRILGTAPLNAEWLFPLKNNSIEESRKNIEISILRLNEDFYASLHRYAKDKKATINDVILAAYYRSLCSITGKYGSGQLGIDLTLDMRKYFSDYQEELICNLASSEKVYVEISSHDSFETTLSRVQDKTSEMKKNKMGVEGLKTFEFLGNKKYKDLKEYFRESMSLMRLNKSRDPILSNFGILFSEKLFLGEVVVEDAYLVSPYVQAPSFMLGVSCYNQKITFTVTYDSLMTSMREVELLLNTIAAELILEIA
ncbi:hypothetical protein [Saccharibacillus sacchari]|uniref:Uncharacterized protein n=1 Tax=Saccharibacillus sacchari TaxID=456493 RepID=A0ACC6P6W0_9BACL